MATRKLIYNPELGDIRSTDWSLISIPRFGTSGADTLRGSAGKDTFYGYGSSDTFIGNGGVDTFNGGDGTDTVDYSNVAEQPPEYFLGRTGVIVNLANEIGGEVGEAYDHYDSIENITGSNFDDAIFGDANANVLRGMNGNDIIEGGASGDTLDGGEGSDTLSYAGSNARVAVNLQNNTATGGHATGDVISLFENITGSGFNDTLTGNNDDNTIEGGAGADTLDGAGGLNDTVSYRYSNAGVAVNLANNTASGGHAAGDIIIRFENIEGSSYNDTLTGSGLNNVIRGGAGIDTIDGGRGTDTIEGGADNDIMTGGMNGDTFVFEFSADTDADHITDFNVFEDKLQFDVEGPTTVDYHFETVNSTHVNMIFDLGNGDTLTLDNIDAVQALLVAAGAGVEFV